MSSTALQLVPPEPLDTSALSAESSALVLRAEALQVTDAASYAVAAEFGKGCKALLAVIDSKTDPNVARWHAGHKAACADQRELQDPANRAIKITARKMTDWKREDDARAERARLQRVIEARKLAEEQQLAEAIELEAEGDTEGAEEVLAAPPAPIFIAPRPTAPKVAGISTPKRWTFEVDDVASVIKHIAGVPQDKPLAHPELVPVLCVDSAPTRRLVTNGNFAVPGIRAYQDEGVSFGKGK